ncbi:SDR family NAD(P)-dependent oxidoreductase [Thalassoglobus sp. JC818]|uniref:SDR family NAD(P)-dependent oxidoreductase n=1 Tax=Thalassoglobus sp. JC818 TaxID=3232136 RepID=UPI00345A03BB
MKRTVLVSGGNRGIGLAIVTALAEQGNAVWLGSRELAEGERVAASFEESGLDVTAVQLDLADASSIESAVNRVQGAGYPISALVNNAGVYHDRPLLELTDAETAESLSVHLTGPIRLIRALVPDMTSRGYGRIVNVSSSWGSFAEGLGGPGAYGVTKAALNALTVRLANELPSTIKVNSMCPGWVRTRMGGGGATRSPEEGAKTAVWLATLPDDGPTGGFFRDEEPIEW